MEDIEANGQGAMLKYMDDEEVMTKLGKRFQEAMQDPELQARLQQSAAEQEASAAEADGGEETAEGGAVEETVLSLASEGERVG